MKLEDFLSEQDILKLKTKKDELLQHNKRDGGDIKTVKEKSSDAGKQATGVVCYPGENVSVPGVKIFSKKHSTYFCQEGNYKPKK
jgi:hypothetical protein